MLTVPESDVMRALTDALEYGGWLWHHCRDSRLCSGTPGLPDLIAVHPRTNRIVWLEAKGSKGRTSRDQKSWLSALGGGVGDQAVVTPETVNEWVQQLANEAARGSHAV